MTPFAYIFRLHNGACDLLEFPNEAQALEHANLNPHRYKSVWNQDGRCVWFGRHVAEGTQRTANGRPIVWRDGGWKWSDVAR